MKKVAVVILNWNGKKFLEQFLQCLVDNTPSALADIVIIDNASTDDSLEYLKSNFPDIKTVVLDKNYGFAGGYNRGLKEVEAEYYLLLNSDIEVTEGWLEPLVEMLDNDKSISVCGPKLLSYYEKDKFEYAGAAGGFIDRYAYPFCRGRIFDTCETDSGQYDTNIECFWISGAAFMVRAEIFNMLNGFDDEFFAHQEEIDLCWRIQNSGYKIVIQTKSTVYHVGAGTLPKSSPFKTYLNFRNNLYIIEKNIPKYKRNKVKFVRLFLDQVAFFKILLQGKPVEAFSICKAYFHFWKNAKKMSKHRKIVKPKALKYIKTYYNRSIVFDYYLKRIKSFDKLKF